MALWEEQLNDIMDFSVFKLSDIEPADWAEQNMHITTGPSPGALKYDITPFFREPVNCLSPYHPANRIVFMGGAQLGKSKVLIEAIIAYYISQHPCNILYLTGHSELSEESIIKLDSAIDNSGLRPLIKKQTLSKKNTQTGDTKLRKEFAGGMLISGSATNHKVLRGRDPRLVIADDIEEANNASKKSGSTIEMIEMRTNSYGLKKKILYVSTPLLKQGSMIDPLYYSGDQRKYLVPCQCCGTMIELKWSGFIWELENNRLIEGSVRYLCQVCGDTFDDSNKYEFNQAGIWQPTAVAQDPLTVSFYLPGWYAAPMMDNWEAIVKRYLKATIPVIDKKALQTFTNLTKGESYEDDFEELKANVLQSNTRDYNIGIIPERLSLQDGNGHIVLVTCAADMNGLLENGRLDWEVVAWAENGASYSIQHGSIGTFIPATIKTKQDKEEEELKEWWTYEENKPLCIWDEFERLLKTQFTVDVKNTVPRSMPIAITALDTGYLKTHAFTFIEKMVNRGVMIQGVKGKGDGEYQVFIDDNNNTTELDKRVIAKGKEMANDLWTLEVGYIKDKLAILMNMKWKKGIEPQPSGFMNFPHPGNGLYEWANFFEHFESEKRVLVANKAASNVKAQWVKKLSNSQNHLWDCRVYNMAIKEIWVEILREKYGKKDFRVDWNEYVKMVLQLPQYKSLQ